ncbi:MAG: hypothetical protein RR123_02175, partial [Clostridia bacterium]
MFEQSNFSNNQNSSQNNCQNQNSNGNNNSNPMNLLNMFGGDMNNMFAQNNPMMQNLGNMMQMFGGGAKASKENVKAASGVEGCANSNN